VFDNIHIYLIVGVGYHVYGILLAELISQICVSVMLLLVIIRLHHIMRMYGAVEVPLNSFLFLALNEGNTLLWKLSSQTTG